MKQSSQIRSFLKQVPLLVALLAAFVFSASNGLRPLLQEANIRAELQQDSQDQKDERPQASFDYGCNALAPVAQLVFLHQFFVEAPLPPLFPVKEESVALPLLRVDPYFKTLFRLIISPNAP